MPLCNRRQRDITCYEEHQDNQGDVILGCHSRDVYILPMEYRQFSMLDEDYLNVFQPALPPLDLIGNGTIVRTPIDNANNLGSNDSIGLSPLDKELTEAEMQPHHHHDVLKQ